MKKTAWIVVLGLIGLLYVLSSIPGLQVLPVLRQLNQLMTGLDLTLTHLAEWLAAHIPINFYELGPIDQVMQDFLDYVRENPTAIEFLLRKIAHVVVFAVLTVALFFLLYQYIPSALLSIGISFLGGFVLAVLDEYRQSFVPGRIASPVDVFINMIGVTLAVMLILFALLITSGQRQRYFQYRGLVKKQDQQQAAKQVSLKKASGRYRKETGSVEK